MLNFLQNASEGQHANHRRVRLYDTENVNSKQNLVTCLQLSVLAHVVSRSILQLK